MTDMVDMTKAEVLAIWKGFVRNMSDQGAVVPFANEIANRARNSLLAQVEAAEKERDNANAAAVGVALKAEMLEADRDHANQRYSSAVRLLTGIHALLYPPRFTDHDWRTWQFKSPLAEEQMQELSDRIRALPDEIARTALEKSK